MRMLILTLVAGAGLMLALGYLVGRGRFGDSRNTLAAVIGVLALGLAVRSIRTIPAGHVGIQNLFGSVADDSLGSGLRLVNPLVRVIPMSVMTQEQKETLEVPTREGLTVTMDVSILYRLDPQSAAAVYRAAGPRWAEILLTPQVRSVVRGVTATYEAKALYTSTREDVSNLIVSGLTGLVGARGVIVEAAALRQLTLPRGLAASIEQKLQAEQESQRMEFVLLKEKQEAERKRIEAQGIDAYQRVVAASLTPALLRFRGIEATLKLAESSNSKVVVVGSGPDGLPIILGGTGGER
jgi:regulator of protease activity HflC (stomatin/prohibitin superfamily)